MAVNPDPRTSVPATTRAAVTQEAAKRLDCLDDIGFLLVVLNNAEVVSLNPAITGGIVILASMDDHRDRLKLIWILSEAAHSMVRQGWHPGYVAARFTLNVSIW